MDILTQNSLATLYRDGRVTFTPRGLAYFRPLFGRAGFDIRTVNTIEVYHRALRAIRPLEFDALAESQSQRQALQETEARLLASLLPPDNDSTDPRPDKSARQHRHGLHLVKLPNDQTSPQL